MRLILVLLALSFTLTVQASDYCKNQKLLGFEEAVYLRGAENANHDPQTVIDALVGEAAVDLVRIDSFVTASTFYELLRERRSNELFLMTVSKTHVCFYQVPSAEPVQKKEHFA